MIHWIASSNWDNWKILEQKHVWGVPKRNRTLMQRVKPGDTILVYVRQEKEGDTILPSAITGAYEVVSEPYEDHTRLFTTPPQMGDEVFPFRMKVHHEQNNVERPPPHSHARDPRRGLSAYPQAGRAGDLNGVRDRRRHLPYP